MAPVYSAITRTPKALGDLADLNVGIVTVTLVFTSNNNQECSSAT